MAPSINQLANAASGSLGKREEWLDYFQPITTFHFHESWCGSFFRYFFGLQSHLLVLLPNIEFFLKFGVDGITVPSKSRALVKSSVCYASYKSSAKI